MSLEFYQQLPQLINPIAFSVGAVAVRWYSLMYLLGFLVVYFLLQWRIKKGEAIKFELANDLPTKQVGKLQDMMLDFMLASFVGGLIGGRLGYALFYNLPYFLAHPLQLISPYDFASHAFVGLYGMSFFGALVGGVLGAYFFAKRRKLDFLRLADFVVPALPAGYFFGRVGNFLNGELVGRVTTSQWGMYFSNSSAVLRMPSQLLEALLEGALLFVILWLSRKQEKFVSGFLLVIYFFGYGLARFGCEFFRQPDSQIGFMHGGFTLGQIFSLLLICFSIGWLFFNYRKGAILKK
ncbi:MAG: prolipoprotein diacylglyceryl transferase [Candidatus Moraniibacteriota bacterium]